MRKSGSRVLYNSQEAEYRLDAFLPSNTFRLNKKSIPVTSFELSAGNLSTKSLMKLADGTTSAVRSSVTRNSTYGLVGTNKV